MIRAPIAAVRVGFIVYALALATLTHWPKLDSIIDNNSVWFGIDKWGHLGTFAVWSLLLLATGWLGRNHRRAAVTGIIIGIAYALVDEITQGLFLPDRFFTLSDIVASSLGVGLGVLIWRFALWIDKPTEGFVSHARVMSGLTLLSRCFGLVRDWALAFLFGFSWVLDAYAVAFMIPNLFRRMFGEGALAGAFVPHYTDLKKLRVEIALSFAVLVIHWLVRVLLWLTILGCVILLTLLLTGVLDQRGQLMATLTVVSIWYMPLVCLAAILGAMLQVHGRFAVPSASPILLNLFIIAACIYCKLFLADTVDDRYMALIVIGCVVIAGLSQVTWHAAALRDAGANLPRWKAADSAYRRHRLLRETWRAMLRQWLPTVLGLAVFQINTLADAMIATFFSAPNEAAAVKGFELFGHALDYPMRAGSVAVLGAAARLYEFPLGVFGIAIATAIFPALSRTADEPGAFGDLLRRGLRLAAFIGLPATVGLILIRNHAVGAIYAEGGRIKAEDAGRIAFVLLGYAPAIWAYSMNHTLVRIFYAQKNPKTPMRVSIAMVALNLALNLTLIWVPIGGGERLGAAGLAWSTAACAMLQCGVLLLLVRRYVSRPIDTAVLGSWLRSAVAAAVMGGAVYGALTVFGDATTRGGHILGCFVGIAVGAAAMVAASLVLRQPELKWVLRRDRSATT